MEITASNYKEIIDNYRFKTKEEFETEFGPDWRNRVPMQFVSGMDYLLNQPLIEVNITDPIRFIRDDFLKVGSWSVNPQMLMEIDNVKQHNRSITDKDTARCFFKIIE